MFYCNQNLFDDINRVKKHELDDDLIIPCSRCSNNTENQNFDKIGSHFLRAEEFESKINKFFQDLKLKQLPNYFFKLKKKIIYSSKIIINQKGKIILI